MQVPAYSPCQLHRCVRVHAVRHLMSFLFLCLLFFLLPCAWPEAFVEAGSGPPPHCELLPLLFPLPALCLLFFLVLLLLLLLFSYSISRFSLSSSLFGAVPCLRSVLELLITASEWGCLLKEDPVAYSREHRIKQSQNGFLFQGNALCRILREHYADML